MSGLDDVRATLDRLADDHPPLTWEPRQIRAALDEAEGRAQEEIDEWIASVAQPCPHHVLVVVEADGDVVGVIADDDALEVALRAWFWQRETEHRTAFPDDEANRCLWHHHEVDDEGWTVYTTNDPADGDPFLFQSGYVVEHDVWGSVSAEAMQP